MIKKIVSLACVVLSCMTLLRANDEVLLTIDGKPVYASEFEYIYTKNNASEALKRVIHNLKTLKEENKKYLTNIGGTYKWRNIADSNNLSPHSFGIAIDINVKYSRYWLWDIQTNNNKKIPCTIVHRYF